MSPKPEISEDRPPPVQVRIPANLLKRIDEAAEDAGRKRHAEILFRLEAGLLATAHTQQMRHFSRS